VTGSLLLLPGVRAFASSRFRLAVAVLLLVVAAAIHVAVIRLALLHLNDFHDMVAATQLILSGGSPYQPLDLPPPDRSGFGPQHSNYPPTAYVLLAPIAALPGPVRDIGWVLLIELSLAGVVALVYRGIGRPTVIEGIAVAALLLLFYPVLDNLAYGQVNLLVLLLVAVAVLAHQRGRPTIGGLALAVGVALKLTPLPLLLYFAWRRDWRLVAACVAALGLLAGATLALGWGPRWVEYTAFVGPLGRGTASVDNQTLNGMLLRAWRPDLSGFPIGPLPPAFVAAWYAAEAGLLGVLLLALRGARVASGLRTWLEVAIILVAVPLLQPVAWHHHHALAVLAIVVAVRLGRLHLLPGLALAGLIAAYILATPVAATVEGYAIAAGGVALAQQPFLAYSVSAMVLAAVLTIVSLGRVRPTPTEPV
jgi:alpha-1,2-mannosyltransferase